MAPEDILVELKNKKLPVFGTNKERVERLKKALGIPIQDNGSKASNSVLNNIEQIQKKREERRRRMEEERINKEERKAENEALGKLVDVDFQKMVDQFKQQVPPQKPHVPSSELKICVCVRKRPIFSKEEKNGEIDALSCSNPIIMIHEPKLKVDGITKYLENHTFQFDNTYGESEDTKTVYESSIRPLCPFILQGGTVTCFAYGQTGSGKTFTMRGLQEMVICDLDKFGRGQLTFHISFYEIYGGRCFDLLNNRAKLTILEDGNGNIQIQGLVEHPVANKDEVLQLIEYGNSVRTTHATTSNEDSSRSHAICQIILKSGQREFGRLRLVDLAGSERAQDCVSNNRQRRIEGAEINKSLLALKECIRALRGGPGAHVPYRGSKLTLVLRDSFEGGSDEKKVIMITCVCPGHSSSDHTLNSLRYADRLKEQVVANQVNQFQPKHEPLKPIQEQPKLQPEPAKPQPSKKNLQPQAQQNQLKKKDEKPEVADKFRKSFRDMEYIQKQEEDKMSLEMLDLHEKVETILEEEEELLETHVHAIKEDAQILTEEGELISMAQGDTDYDIDSYVQRMEILVKHKLTVYQNLYQKVMSFKAHLNEEEEFSNHMTQKLKKKG
eukprot:CAMPEP_0202942106 /NCGR_PEP_ID=MMETSP1395-20130829/2275_1 /ASSEMBLY_ACC=CAM_ASM_000871 /TAXON_ID=5961 /ORGANISM="Blepharisma japonicum, Strain Stock R1072" /LENGTH=612 /DNA_ID=CAMNT_0049637997 /DNA_START=53 /DNA_END=1891 /DNA_ORIENTATION=-